MSSQEFQILMERLDYIQRRLDELYVPVKNEEQRQLLTAPPAVRKQHNKDLLQRKRAELKQPQSKIQIRGGSHGI